MSNKKKMLHRLTIYTLINMQMAKKTEHKRPDSDIIYIHLFSSEQPKRK